MNGNYRYVEIAVAVTVTSHCSYIDYSVIAAKLIRQALKPEFRKLAEKRGDSHIRFTSWKDGKPGICFFFILFG